MPILFYLFFSLPAVGQYLCRDAGKSGWTAEGRRLVPSIDSEANSSTSGSYLETDCHVGKCECAAHDKATHSGAKIIKLL